ncbi:MAG: GGDEF domain-containing protein, partial [Bacteroidetes bacterium]
MRITKKVFTDLAIFMIVFGLVIGFVFPWFVILLGVPREIAIKPGFYVSCLSAGALAGIINYFLALYVVGSRIQILADGMATVETKLRELTLAGKTELCNYEDCSIIIDSEDIIGESAQVYNRLVKTLADSLQTQQAVSTFSDMLASTLDLETLALNSLGMFLENSGSNGGAVFYDEIGELKIAANLGLKDPEVVAASDHVQIALQRRQTKKITLPKGVRMEGILADFHPSEILVLP